MKFNICFESKYKGMLKDVLKIKIKNMFNMIFFGFLFLFVGIYVLFLRFNEPVLWYHNVLGYLLIILGLLFIVFSPFGFLLKKYNKGFMDKINIEFYKKDNEWFYHLRGTKNNASYEEEYKINLVEIKKGICIFSSLNGNEFFIPLKELNEDNINDLYLMKNEILKLRIKK